MQVEALGLITYIIGARPIIVYPSSFLTLPPVTTRASEDNRSLQSCNHSYSWNHSHSCNLHSCNNLHFFNHFRSCKNLHISNSLHSCINVHCCHLFRNCNQFHSCKNLHSCYKLYSCDPFTFVQTFYCNRNSNILTKILYIFASNLCIFAILSTVVLKIRSRHGSGSNFFLVIQTLRSLKK